MCNLREVHCTYCVRTPYITSYTVLVLAEERNAGCDEGVLISDNNIGLNGWRRGCARQRGGKRKKKDFRRGATACCWRVYTHTVAEVTVVEACSSSRRVWYVVSRSVHSVIVRAADIYVPGRFAGRFTREEKRKKVVSQTVTRHVFT